MQTYSLVVLSFCGALTLSVAFALGFLYGRKDKAVEFQVPPGIVYLPVSRTEDYASSVESARYVLTVKEEGRVYMGYFSSFEAS